MRPPIVYITNKSGHDYTPAMHYGTLLFLTEGRVKQFSTNTIYREFIEKMSGSEDQDFLLISSLSILNSIATGILAIKHSKVNFLMFRDGKYLERSINFNALI
jgi:hypothetical protein